MKELDVTSAIAGEIMTPFVIMLKVDNTIEDVIKILYEEDISAVFVQEKLKKNYYIISQADIVKFLYTGGMFKYDIANTPVSRIMRGPIKMLDIDRTIDKVIRFMTKHNFKRVLISKDGKPTGVISTRDIMKWNNTYFKPARPQILLFTDNFNSNLIAKHIFEENIEDDVKSDLIDIYGGALSSISMMTDEIITKSGKMLHLMKDRRSILFEPHRNITGILICDYNSIELRRKLQVATVKFYKANEKTIKPAESKRGILVSCDIESIIPLFKED